MLTSSPPPLSQIVQGLNSPPVVDLNGTAAGTSTSVKFYSGGSAVTIAPNGTISDSDSPTLASLTVTITNLHDGAAEVLDANLSGTSITKSYANGVLTLSGIAPVTDYIAVLDSITYNDTATTPSARPSAASSPSWPPTESRRARRRRRRSPIRRRPSAPLVSRRQLRPARRRRLPPFSEHRGAGRVAGRGVCAAHIHRRASINLAQNSAAASPVTSAAAAPTVVRTGSNVTVTARPATTTSSSSPGQQPTP